MEITDVGDSLEKISLAADQKKAFLQLIDSKVNTNMKEVMAEFKLLENKIQMMHDKLSNEIKVIYWVVGISNAILLFMIARK